MTIKKALQIKNYKKSTNYDTNCAININIIRIILYLKTKFIILIIVLIDKPNLLLFLSNFIFKYDLYKFSSKLFFGIHRLLNLNISFTNVKQLSSRES